MTFQSNFLLLMVLVAFTFCHVFADDQKLHGDWQSISINDINNPKLVDIAKFAVNTENMQSENIGLEFQSLSDGRIKVDNNGTTYDLTIVAMEFDEVNVYEIVVFENSKDQVRKLISFD
ncbi:hypothetical protein R3W88_028457 [Solanum pinnatisectum]|uniref:Cystatin domain-containing protein n=1 Tax=Solanum pinnatisectum TaxID=50273 RepID=A0AAV9K5T0_9SOLN|nr:hypothetical protein R3W88_028457 [Solanum pinnatisectum]